MAVNLLPRELKPRKYIVKISRVLTNVTLVALLVFVVSAAVMTGIFLLISNSLSDAQEKQEELKVQIEALQETEQKIVLIKDRLEKVIQMKSKASVTDKVDVLEEVLNLSEGTAVIDSAVLTSDQVNVSVNVNGSRNLTRFLSNTVLSGSFKRINMLSFALDKEEGYNLEFGLVE